MKINNKFCAKKCQIIGIFNKWIKKKFSILTDNYDEYKKYLISVHEKMKKESYETTNILKDILL